MMQQRETFMRHIHATAFGEVGVAEFTPTCGWTFAYNVNTDLVSTTLDSGTVTQADGMAALSTGAAASQSAKIETKRVLRYIPGQGGLARFTAIFTTGVAGSTQIIGLGDGTDGLFFGYNGAAFAVLRRVGGVDNWTPASQWSENDQNNIVDILDPTKGNVFQIRYQWLGFGAIKYYVEDPESGELELVHKVKYPNSAIAPSILNPTLPIMAEVANTTNETDIVLKTPSAIGGVEGKIFGPPPIHPFSLFRSTDASLGTITTEAAVLTIRNKSTYQSKTNRVRVRPRLLSVSSDGTKAATIRLTKNTTLGGTPSYSDYSTNTSPVDIDTAGTTLTGGQVVGTFILDKVDAQVFDLDILGIELAPGETLTASAESDNATDVVVAINWVDKF